MKHSITALFILFSSIVNIPVAASPCTSEDLEKAKAWDDWYVPDEAYSFGLKIQDYVKSRDIDGLFSLIEGELKNGPRKAFIKGKSFHEIFDEEWTESVQTYEPSCSPVGDRGFMLGAGHIWYNNRHWIKNTLHYKWQIIAINGATNEEPDQSEVPIGWEVDGTILPPQCFSQMWVSGDNYEEFADQFNIENYGDFFDNVGLYFGREITSLLPINLSWNVEDSISLVRFTKSCADNNYELDVEDRVIRSVVDSTDYMYKLISPVTSSRCSKLAPNIDGDCDQSYLVEISEDSGGSFGWYRDYTIFGLFELRDGGKAIVPLKRFESENDALNYLDE